MAYTIEDYKAARDAFAGRLKMSKQAGDISDGFRRRDDRIALDALDRIIKLVKSEKRCPRCGVNTIEGGVLCPAHQE